MKQPPEITRAEIERLRLLYCESEIPPIDEMWVGWDYAKPTKKENRMAMRILLILLVLDLIMFIGVGALIVSAVIR